MFGISNFNRKYLFKLIFFLGLKKIKGNETLPTWSMPNEVLNDEPKKKKTSKKKKPGRKTRSFMPYPVVPPGMLDQTLNYSVNKLPLFFLLFLFTILFYFPFRCPVPNSFLDSIPLSFPQVQAATSLEHHQLRSSTIGIRKGTFLQPLWNPFQLSISN